MLRISAANFSAIRQHAEQAYPFECCGILVGRFDGAYRYVEFVVLCTNAAVSRRSVYEIDSRELVRAQRQAREQGLEIVGFYHSHPDHPPQPSPTDLEQAHWIGCSYVITSVSSNGIGHTKSFLLDGRLEDNKQFLEEQLVIGSS